MEVEIQVFDFIVKFILFKVFLKLVDDDFLTIFSLAKHIRNKHSSVSVFEFLKVFLINLMCQLKPTSQFY
jgi:hypothetical protein